ncbi:MAG: hypothetical protein HND27_09215 [Bacteroidetes bacterium]|nr:hypothetical protein [Flavobacteriales bacterium]NOG95942.1 hypothetical protein [Bacteroidota bacterium]
MHKANLFLIFLLLLAFAKLGAQTRYYSQMSGNHNANIWDVVPVGTPGPAVFDNNSTFVIQTGHIVTLNSSPVTLDSLIIQTGAKFFRNNTSEAALYYINLCGSIICNGDFGNDGILDAIGVNIQANKSHTISGTGKFNALRIRNSDETNDGATRGNTTTTIAMNVNLRWTGTLGGSGINALYNNRDAIFTFDVIINNGCTLNIIEPTAGAGVDGPGTGTYAASHRGGIWTVNGVFTINGKLWLGSNNTSNKPVIVIGSTGVMNVGIIDYGTDNANQCAQMTINGGATNGRLNIMGIGGTGAFLNTNVGTTTYNLSNANSQIEYSGSGAQMVEKSIAYQKLKISNTGVRSLNGFTTANQLILANGELNLNGYSLTIISPLTTGITRTGGYVKSELTNNSSKLRWFVNNTTGAHTFPFGVNNSIYIPLTYNLVSGDVDTVTISTYGTPTTNLPWPTTPSNVNNLNSLIGLLPDNRDATVDRFWQIGKSIGAGTPSSVTLTFTYASAELPIPPYNVPTDMRAQRYQNAPTNKWQLPLAGQTTGANSVTVPNVPSGQLVNYPWAIASILSPLPIELVSFEAMEESPYVKLFWATQSENNSSHFIVQKTADFEKVYDTGTIPASGNSRTLVNYNYTDKNPLNGNSYYRLKQVDFDGKTSFSDWISINIGTISNTHAFISNNQVYLSLESITENMNYHINVFDVHGKLLFSTKLQNPEKTVVLSNLLLQPNQLYFISVSNESEAKTFKLLAN